MFNVPKCSEMNISLKKKKMAIVIFLGIASKGAHASVSIVFRSFGRVALGLACEGISTVGIDWMDVLC